MTELEGRAGSGPPRTYARKYTDSATVMGVVDLVWERRRRAPKVGTGLQVMIGERAESVVKWYTEKTQKLKYSFANEKK